MENKDLKANISEAFTLIVELYGDVQCLLLALDRDFNEFKKVPIIDAQSAHNFMTWHHLRDVYGWIHTVFYKVYTHPNHPDKLFVIEIDLSGGGLKGPLIWFAVHHFENPESRPSKFNANDGWLYHQRRTNAKHFTLTNNTSKPIQKEIENDKSFIVKAHKGFKFGVFSSMSLFDITLDNLEDNVLTHFANQLAQDI